jgi:hypothetical protein
MRSHWARWTVGVILGCLALPVLAFIVLRPEAAIIMVAVLVYPLFGTTHPPPMFEADLAGMWNKWDEASRKITARLQEQFPAGMTEAVLKSTLIKQGFKPLPPPPADCVPAGQQMPVGKTYRPCPTSDPSKTLTYRWGGGVCTSTISVRWETNSDKAITKVTGGYNAACL